jgi:hypothetical protein
MEALFLLLRKNNEGCFCMVFVVGQVGVDTQVDSKQTAMQLSLRKDNLLSQLDRRFVQRL